METELLINETGHITKEVINDKTVRPGCLGQLNGPLAEWKESTRNDRYYSKKLWQKVFDTPWVKEALSTHTLFGEADHPNDRLEPKLMNAAVVLTSYNLNDSDQTVYGTFDILDTPSGRILRTLADYGCQLGVSSRGRGKIVTRNGRKSVDEDSYVFGGFDVVALPAVKKARENFIKESVDGKTMSESIVDQINKCSSANDLMIIKNILKSANLDESSSYDSLIESKLSELKTDDNTIVNGLTSDLKEAYAKISDLETKLSDSSTNTISTEEQLDNLELMNQLLHENSSYASVIDSLKSQLKEKSELVEKLSNQKPIIKEKVISRTEKGSDIRLESLKSDLAESSEKIDTLSEQLSNANDDLQSALDENKSLKSNIEKLTDKVNSTEADKKSLSDKLSETVDDYNALADSYNNLVSENDALMNYYISQQSVKVGMTSEELIGLLPENFTVNDVDRIVKSRMTAKKRTSRLPITHASLEESTVIGTTTRRDSDHNLDDARIILASMKQ